MLRQGCVQEYSGGTGKKQEVLLKKLKELDFLSLPPKTAHHRVPISGDSNSIQELSAKRFI